MKKFFAVVISCVVLVSCVAFSANAQEINTLHPTVAITSTAPTNIDTVLDGIAHCQPGTTGSSLKCAQAAYDVLKWTSNNKCDKNAVKAYYAALDSDAQANFAESFKEVDGIVRDIITGNDAVLDDAGLRINFRINLINYTAFRSAVKNAERTAGNATAILDEIAGCQPGTTGSSLKCAQAAYDVLKWTSNNKCDKNAVKAYYAALDSDAQANFAESFKEVDGIVRDIIIGNDTILEDAGLGIDFRINLINYTAFRNAVRAAIA